MKLKSLNCNFLTDTDIVKLNIANIHTSEQLSTYADLESLSRLASVDLQKLKLTKKFIVGQFSPFPEFGHNIFDKCLKKSVIISTGSKQIDELISNGFYSSEISEITGATSTGKSQLCFSLIVNMLYRYSSHNCLYIDSNKSFCSRRVFDLLKFKLHSKQNTQTSTQSSVNDKANSLLKQIKVVDCKDVFHLIDVLFQIEKVSSTSVSILQNQKVNNENGDGALCPSLLVIDNLSSLFHQFKVNNNIELNFFLNYIINRLRYLAHSMNMVIVVVTNHNDYNSSFRYSSASSYSTLNLNCLYNSTWKSVPGLIVNLVKLDENSQESDSQDGNPSGFRRKFQLLKCNRPSFKENCKNFCYFDINNFGLI